MTFEETFNILRNKGVTGIEEKAKLAIKLLKADAMQRQADAIESIGDMMGDLLVALADTAISETIEVKNSLTLFLKAL